MNGAAASQCFGSRTDPLAEIVGQVGDVSHNPTPELGSPLIGGHRIELRRREDVRILIHS